jgi:hypothetical protein
MSDSGPATLTCEYITLFQSFKKVLEIKYYLSCENNEHWSHGKEKSVKVCSWGTPIVNVEFSFFIEFDLIWVEIQTKECICENEQEQQNCEVADIFCSLPNLNQNLLEALPTPCQFEDS